LQTPVETLPPDVGILSSRKENLLMSNYELGVVGGGSMAEAIVGGALRAGFLAAGQIVVAEPLAERREKLAGDWGISCVADNATAAACPRVLLAVKPQVMADALTGAATAVSPDALVIGIAAGLSTGWYDERLGGTGRIVRVMPNTPLLVGAGASGLCAGPRAAKTDLAWVRQLLTCGGGLAVELDEPEMDALTALSGAGPAYFFYLIEAMVAAGAAEGLSPADAAALTVQTCAGAAKLLEATGQTPEELRRRVTSSGGVTQRAIEILDAAGVKDRLVEAIRAAAARSRELGA
jgi:pyrroline-5-carboxylate reductase